MIAPDTITNTLERNAWERGYSEAIDHDRIPDSQFCNDAKERAAYWAGWDKGRADKIKK